MKKLIVFIATMIFLASSSSLLVAGTIKGKIKAIGSRHSGDAVVYIKKVSGNFQPPEKHAEMDQKNLIFIPHVVPVLAGTAVDFLNSDTILHNVFTFNKCADRFNLGTYPQGVKKSHTFKKPCIAAVLCNVHPEMEAFVVVLENPYFAVSDKKGNYKIENLPAGKYELKTWHEKLKSQSKDVTVPENGEVEVNFKLKR